MRKFLFLYGDGVPLNQIADQLGLSQEQMTNALWNIQRVHLKKSRFKMKQLAFFCVKDRVQEVGIMQVSKELNIQTETLGRRFNVGSPKKMPYRDRTDWKPEQGCPECKSKRIDAIGNQAMNSVLSDGTFLGSMRMYTCPRCSHEWDYSEKNGAAFAIDWACIS